MEMKPYQIACVSHLKKNPRCIIDSYMGTGKTLMALTATFLRKPQKVLIACSKNALGTWKKQIAEWYPEYDLPEAYMIVSGPPMERKKLWSKDALFYVCTYSVLRNDINIVEQISFDVFLLDEFHRSGLRQHQVTKTRKTNKETGVKIKTPTGYGLIKRLAHIPCIHPISGTVLSRGPQDLWPTLNILDAHVFASYWKFINTFCIIIKGPFGMHIEGVQNTVGLRAITKPYWYKIPKKIAEEALPPLTRQLIPIEMSRVQKQLYEKFEKEMYIELTDGSIKAASTTLSVGIRLRQLLTCPKIIDPGLTDYGAGIEAVVDIAKDIEKEHIVVFTPFREGVLYLKQYLKENLTTQVYHIWGGLEPEELHARIKAWKQTKGAMVCTVLFSQSFELETSDVCFFVGYEWDQNDNNQASSRLRRLISPKPISAYYIQHHNTIDDRILEVLNSKTDNVRITTQDFKDIYTEYLKSKYGAST